MTLSYRRVSDLQDFKQLADSWRSLLSDSPEQSAPLGHDWHLTWWQSFGKPDQLSMGCVYENDELIAIAPMMTRTERVKGLPLTVCELMNNGYSPLGGIVHSGDISEQQLANIVELLITQNNADLLRLQKLPTTSALFAAFAHHHSANSLHGSSPSLTTPVIPVTGDWNEYLQNRSKSFRKSIRRKLKKAAALTDANVHEHRVESRHDPVLQNMVDISARSWKAPNKTDLRNDREGLEFLLGLVDVFAPDNKISLWTYSVGSQPIAFEFLLIDGGVAYPIRADFDQSTPELSPGTVLLCHVLEAMFARESVSFYDCCSDDYSYLSSWTETYRAHCDLEFYGTGIKPRLAHFAKHRFAPHVRNLKSAAASMQQQSRTGSRTERAKTGTYGQAPIRQ